MTGEPENDWLTPKEAAWLLGLSTDHFRRVYCGPQSPKIQLRVAHGARGQRRILIRRKWVLDLIESQIQKPAK